jgi:hypothetical protein
MANYLQNRIDDHAILILKIFNKTITTTLSTIQN